MIIILLLFCSNTFAVSFRCKTGKFVQTSDSKSDVIKNCGQPISKSLHKQKVWDGHRYRSQTCQIWVYKPNKYQYFRHVYLCNNRVIKIEKGRRN